MLGAGGFGYKTYYDQQIELKDGSEKRTEKLQQQIQEATFCN